MLKSAISVCVALAAAVSTRGAELSRPAANDAPASPALRLTHCLVSLIDDIEVPAERQGVLTAMSVKEGDYVARDAPLASIDERQAKLQAEMTNSEAVSARAKAANRLEVEYAVATHRTAEAEYQIALSANTKQPNAVSFVELEKLRLAAEQARIKIGVTEFEQSLRGLDARGFDAKAGIYEMDLERRRILAPLAAEVVEIYFRPGEWVEPGKPVVRLVRLDRLRVEGFVRFAEHAPADVMNQPVTVTVAFAGGKTETFEGRIAFVSPIVQPGGDYRIWAEVENRQDRGQWLLRPGVEAEMTVGQ